MVHFVSSMLSKPSPSLQRWFRFGEQEKVAGSQIWRVGRPWEDSDLGTKLRCLAATLVSFCECIHVTVSELMVDFCKFSDGLHARMSHQCHRGQ